LRSRQLSLQTNGLAGYHFQPRTKPATEQSRRAAATAKRATQTGANDIS
jgi:hypothetical protein